MSGKWYHVTEARHHFDSENFIGAYKHAIKAMELFSPNMEEFADLWWILCQCEVEAKKGSCALDRDMRKCENLRKRVFCERRRESSAVLITRITDLIFERRFTEATNAIAHAETLEADFNRFDDESYHHYWSTAILKIELKRLKKHQENLEALIRGFEEKAASIDRQAANATKAETDQKTMFWCFEEKVASLRKQLADAQKSENNLKETARVLNVALVSMNEQLAKVKLSEASLKETVCDLQSKVASLEDQMRKAQELEKTTKERHCAEISSLDAQLSKAKSELYEKDLKYAEVIDTLQHECDTLRGERDQLFSELCCVNDKLEQQQQGSDTSKQVVEQKQHKLVQEPEQETVVKSSTSGLSIGIDNETVSGNPRQTSDTFAPDVSGVQKEWHKQATQGLRTHIVAYLVKTSFVPPVPMSIEDQRAEELKIANARKVEKEMFEKASDLEDYYHLLAQHIYPVQKEIQEKMQQRMRQQRAAAVRTAEDVSDAGGVLVNPQQAAVLDCFETAALLRSIPAGEKGDDKVPSSASSSSFEDVGSIDELSDIEVD